jgi:hypothetical protein
MALPWSKLLFFVTTSGVLALIVLLPLLVFGPLCSLLDNTQYVTLQLRGRPRFLGALIYMVAVISFFGTVISAASFLDTR